MKKFLLFRIPDCPNPNQELTSDRFNHHLLTFHNYGFVLLCECGFAFHSLEAHSVHLKSVATRKVEIQLELSKIPGSKHYQLHSDLEKLYLYVAVEVYSEMFLPRIFQHGEKLKNLYHKHFALLYSCQCKFKRNYGKSWEHEKLLDRTN